MKRTTIRLPHASNDGAGKPGDRAEGTSTLAIEKNNSVCRAVRGRLVAVEYRRRKAVIARKAETSR
jgi:hypothetical protein